MVGQQRGGLDPTDERRGHWSTPLRLGFGQAGQCKDMLRPLLHPYSGLFLQLIAASGNPFSLLKTRYKIDSLRCLVSL